MTEVGHFCLHLQKIQNYFKFSPKKRGSDHSALPLFFHYLLCQRLGLDDLFVSLLNGLDGQLLVSLQIDTFYALALIHLFHCLLTGLNFCRCFLNGKVRDHQSAAGNIVADTLNGVIGTDELRLKGLELLLMGGIGP